MDPNIKLYSKFPIGTQVMGFLTYPLTGYITKIEYEQGQAIYEVTCNNEKYTLEEKFLTPFEPTHWYSVLEKWKEYLRIGFLQQKLLHEMVELMRPAR